MKRYWVVILAAVMMLSLSGCQKQQQTVASDVDLKGYSLVWSDEFDGDSLNRDQWNVEVHNAGWVNEELQAYVDSSNTVSVSNGILHITPVKLIDSLTGKAKYYSGRITTQNKEDFIYGLFEIRAKVPQGQGYLPAFWLMATDENVYGQWPRCGEIDCMEVMGQDTNKVYGTIHYGNPHGESQGTYVITEGKDLSSDFHTYTCEWLPGVINWYIDGVLYHTESNWYTTTEGLGTVTYPAPFDQPFYVILNLAVGGSWVGNPNDSTSFENNDYEIDYVRVYQKESYDENVKKPEVEVTLGNPDSTGNYITDNNWTFLTAKSGVGSADISAEQIVISTEKAGTVDYSIQLVQPGMPLEKGAKYQVQFDACADSDRTMNVDMKAPDRNWRCYMPTQNPDLTKEFKTFTYTFVMNDDTDPNGRLEFNMGATDSTATITIKNISVRKIADASEALKDEKAILVNGNYIYNGSFQEGEYRLGFWTINQDISTSSDLKYYVTDFYDGRRLCMKDNITISQENLGFKQGNDYAFTFDAEVNSSGRIIADIGGNVFEVELEKGRKSYKVVVGKEAVMANSNVSIKIETDDVVYLDDVMLMENAMIKNGLFVDGITCYETYFDSSANASYKIENNALVVTVNKTSDEDWKVQIKQNNILLEKGKKYQLTFSAKSDLDREIRVIMQGLEPLGWPVYSGVGIFNLTNQMQRFTITFTMENETDAQSFFCICLGSIDKVINTTHHVTIDDISLVEIK